MTTKRVFSLDIATTTGWAFMSTNNIKTLKFGTIETSHKLSESQRLVYFREELIKLLVKLKPTHVVIEDVYSGINVKTLKLLAKFAGVAQECCASAAGVESYIIHNNTVKSYFKVKNKEQLFGFVVSVLEWEEKEFSFKKHNDIVDAIAQLMCYLDVVLEVKQFRKNKDYGYLYGV